MILSVVWSYWLGVALVVPALAMVVVTVLLYIAKVSKPRYPDR
jgi:uncharacterized protein (DUF58 family)